MVSLKNLIRASKNGFFKELNYGRENGLAQDHTSGWAKMVSLKNS